MNADSLALSTVEAIFVDIRGRGLLKWIFDPRGAENLIGHFDDGEELRGMELEVQGQIKAAWQVIVGNALTRFYGAALSEGQPATGAVAEWRCFHCDEVFSDAHSAKLHFGMDQCSDPACKIKMGAEKSLLVALRKAENELADAWAAIHNESTEAAKAYYAQQSRHGDQLRAAEELGYERGVRDAKSETGTIDPALFGIAEEMKESGGHWQPCTGCYDTEDGYPTQKYGYSPALQTSIGCGCHECGGLGAVWWHMTDQEIADFVKISEEVDKEHELSQRIVQLEAALRGLSKAYAACNGEDDPAYERAEQLLKSKSDRSNIPPNAAPDQRQLFENAVVARLKESGFLEIEVRTECLIRCGDGYQDEIINAGWLYWQTAIAGEQHGK